LTETNAYLDGPAWTTGPQIVYDRLAERAVERASGNLAGTLALDAGAGTGAATRALLRRGAEVVAVDSSPSMLAELTRQTGGTVPTICADLRHIPVADASYDVAVAACVINHFDEPAVLLNELARVTKPAGTVVATTFGADDHPIKPAVDAVLVQYGYVHPDWYVVAKTERFPLTATVPALTEIGRASELTEVSVELVDVDLSDLPVLSAAAYRLGMAHIAPFMRDLDIDTRRSVEADVVSAVRELPPVRLPMLVLTGRAPGASVE
jgi:ubiquinone/menaquinone biosynthesis C-methylase UbiE